LASAAVADAAPASTPHTFTAKEAEEAYGYLSRLFKSCAPQCEPFPDLMGLATQIDNLIAGLRAAPASDGWDEVEAIRQAIAPVLDWYQSDEHEPRFTVEIVTDIVADLQSDRAELLQLRKAAPASEDHEELRAEATGWKREADRLLQLCQKQSREIEDLTPYIDLFRRLDRKFGCGHTDHGAEDCEALLRHVDELFDRPDAAPASKARIAEAVRWCETADDDCQCGECKAKRELRAILTGRAAKASD
jgi:hypothetical protein